MHNFIKVVFLISFFSVANAQAESLELGDNLQKLLSQKNSEYKQSEDYSFFTDLKKKGDMQKKANAFLDVTFQTHMWGAPDGAPKNVTSYPLEVEASQQTGRWFLPLFLKEPSHRTEGMPKYGVINKWKNLPKAGGIPVDLALIPLLNSNQPPDFFQYEQFLESAIKSGITALNSAGSVQLSYDKIYTQIDDLQGGRIHIIPYIRHDLSLNPRIRDINRGIGGGVYHYSFGMIAAEMFLVGAVRFAPSSPNQVDGYFIPDKDNNIVAAVCYINISNSEDVQKGYINECLMRSLGLPEVSQNTDGVLSLAKEARANDFTQNNYEMLRWLYSSDIKAGDDKYAVTQKLQKIQLSQ